jgi:hypothetical protein
LNNLIALIFRAQRGDRNFGLGGANKILQRGINERRLRVNVEQRRRGAFQAERETIGPSDARSCVELRNVTVAQLAIAGARVLRVSGRDAHPGSVLQRECHSLPERDRFGEQKCGQDERKQ